jgi:capsular polysaccharide export protein
VRHQPNLRRSFLFLQGPHGVFFPKLGEELRAAGHRVHRINFNGGDRATWPGASNFHGRNATWEDFARQFLKRESITDVVLFGDCRPKHVIAIKVAKALGVRVHVFEEGYIRPDWVTLERDGVNGHSTLPRDPDWYLEEAKSLPPVPIHPPIRGYPGVRGWGAFFYYAEAVLHYWRFPFHQTHRPRDPVWEGINFLVRFSMKKREIEHADRAAKRLLGADYVLFPLQLNSDYQIRVHSPFANLHDAIATIIESFARHAPTTLRLAIKEHPLDGGLTEWARVIAEQARRFGVSDRVDFIQHGDVVTLVRNSRGLVTVNSTTGTFALAENVPVVVLGDAVYDIPGITHQAGLDSFWTDPEPVIPEIYDAFYRVLVDRCLIDGAFLSDEGVERLLAGAVRSLTRDDLPVAVLPAII